MTVCASSHDRPPRRERRRSHSGLHQKIAQTARALGLHPQRVGGGLPRLRFAERMQTRWRPVSLDGLLPDDHRVRLVWSFVEGFDLTALLATIKEMDGRPGHPP
jgi:hypothetical protein